MSIIIREAMGKPVLGTIVPRWTALDVPLICEESKDGKRIYYHDYSVGKVYLTPEEVTKYTRES